MTLTERLKLAWNILRGRFPELEETDEALVPSHPPFPEITVMHMAAAKFALAKVGLDRPSGRPNDPLFKFGAALEWMALCLEQNKQPKPEAWEMAYMLSRAIKQGPIERKDLVIIKKLEPKK